MSIGFTRKIKIEIGTDRFSVKTISRQDQLDEAFRLRYKVFQVEMIGHQNTEGLDQDEFDVISDHLAIYDQKTNQMVATCRLNCSLFSSKFYSEQEFNCSALLNVPEVKVEIGRVCVHKDFRKGIIIILLWKALAEYLKQTEARYLFGCGSVGTVDPQEAVLLYRFLEDEKKLIQKFDISPKEKYQSADFFVLLEAYRRPLLASEIVKAKSLLPSLCRSYFDIGCYSPGAPAFDYDFKCIDFLTVLDVAELDPRVRKKMFGE